GSVDRIFLLAPSVSLVYDVRPALQCARAGMDVYFSRCDRVLGLVETFVGTSDRYWCPTAGRVGFRPAVCSVADAALYTKLRQHAWDPSVAWTGNSGGHYGAHELGFLRAYVLPLLHRSACVSCSPRLSH